MKRRAAALQFVRKLLRRPGKSIAALAAEARRRYVIREVETR